MAIRKIARLGHPILRKVGRKLTRDELETPQFSQLLADLFDTLADAGGIGLAAPQIHESLQLAVIEFSSDSARYPGMGELGRTVFVNPRITVLDSTEQTFWEGCLSVPDLRGLVARPRKIQVDFWDESGVDRQLIAEGFVATVIQHELDHLNGILYVDRLKTEPGSTALAFLDEYRRFHLPAADPDQV